ncbi:MAG TPA: YhjD/YihY/BrkB family envelope integrity protein [Acidimicrobiales bacterium]|nr:YhjD/YihY/BrkB family envelope integrity protein [Acidimicrobiales bacterium]
MGAGRGRRLAWRNRLLGAVVTAGAWVAVTLGFRLYVDVIGGANPILGVLGAAIVSLTWRYLLCYTTVLGAELNAVLADRRLPAPRPVPAPRPPEPAPAAVGVSVVAAAMLPGRRRR